MLYISNYSAGGAGGTSITIGTSTITSGTSTRVLYDNAGVVGEYVISGTGDVVMTNSATLTTPRFADNGFIADSNGNEMISFNSNASAVNYLEIENGATTLPPHIRSKGDDANIGLHLVAKGTGVVSVCDATDETKRLLFSVSNNATGILTTFRSNSTGTSKTIDLPNATGTVGLQTGLVANQIAYASDTNTVSSLTTATYPSLTELAFVKGVTSAIQTQLNAKQATITFGTGVLTALGVNIGSAGAPVLFNGALGTPSSGTVTNLTGTASININGTVGATTPAAGTFTTVTTTGNIELGNASDTTISRTGAGQIAVEGFVVPTISSTNTITNKRNQPRVVSAASYTTDTGTSLDVSTCDIFVITAQAGALLFNAPSGTPVQGERLVIRIKDNGTARALTWNAVFRAMGTSLPSTTVLSKTLYLGFFYNSTDTKWDLVASAQEA